MLDAAGDVPDPQRHREVSSNFCCSPLMVRPWSMAASRCRWQSVRPPD